jgi:P27 family predicted phage terminase small subunit
MGKRGPKSAPVQLKVLRGNPGKRKLPRQDVQPAPCVGPPRWLKGPARYEWNRIAPELKRLGLLSKLDRSTLASYCAAYADFRLANEIVAREGRIIQSANGMTMTHPAVHIQNKAIILMRSMAGELGLSPAARSSLEIIVDQGSETQKGKDDPGRFFNGPRPA